ncbi:MAG: DUF4019 domain-containing protein [Mesorhizobium sp.]|uniref:DUF4019 domain-containing protein n=1 Tax=Mesorhizobium sp. TaxID=1871066 RepID=UPI000FE766BB|nr:DUF4019 domain-containing protein [Mesorhizobium sp.]RWD61497.1 MAG: DUF4019 domain-containing protein [Mesorhizobium sp.]RWE41035.1 MAG: DUF4019 domain-containing protein [Mesorhizobium sp.]
MRAAVAFIVLVALTLIDGQPARSQEWTPSQDSVRDATQTVTNYFSMLDSGNPERAYQMMDDAAKSSIPPTMFAEQSEKFRSQAGPLLERKLLKFTWLKDPADAPFPGIYAAVDIATRFEKIDRHCGYIVLYQQPSGGAFHVMRAESNFIDNATAKKIETTNSKLELDKAWAELSRNCPNFR